MKRIIDISEEDYKECKFRKDLLSLGEPTDLTFNMRMETLIANSTPLEKELEKILTEAYQKSCYIERDNRGSTYVQLCLLNGIIYNHIEELKGENNG